MRQHIMPEVSGTEITVTKKATVIKLDQQPPIENNDLQDLFLKAPGFQITDQHTPGQFNFNCRGLGNPQESEFTLVLRDGLPLMSDWIGFPTLYYLPLPQAISEIQFIRGGNSLLYGTRASASSELCDETSCTRFTMEFLYRTDRWRLRILFHFQFDSGGGGSVGISF
jgi:outer membrane receptor for ferrienterochelin and colicin